MEENKENAYRTHKSHAKQINLEEVTSKCSPVCVLVANQFLRNIPTHEQTSEETTRRKHDLTRDEIKPIEERFPEELQTIRLS